jgi:polysaccharide deacetylase 2 family uncharacterized protein YibQ
MPRDELRQPLHKRSTAERLWAKRPRPLTLAIVLALAAFSGGTAWLMRQPHPFAGEPIVTAASPPLEAITTATIDPAQPGPDETAAPEEEITEQEPAPEPELQPEPLPENTIIISASRRPLKPAPIAQVAEAGPDGQLPRIASNGKSPFDVYAQLTPLAAQSSSQPKIAILLGGMGLNTRLTQKAIKELPGNVTFGFAPYGNDLQAQVNKARAQGHEVMLQLPMEPVGYPANDPGPNTLLAEADAADNLKSLHWNMSRFAGYTGISNYMGGRFLATPQSLKPILAELKARGLVFLEDANVAASATAEVASATGLKIRRAEVVIDASSDPVTIQAALEQLEALAKANGMAVGTGAGLEITIDTVADWARELESKGIMLVPVSAAYRGQMG